MRYMAGNATRIDGFCFRVRETKPPASGSWAKRPRRGRLVPGRLGTDFSGVQRKLDRGRGRVSGGRGRILGGRTRARAIVGGELGESRRAFVECRGVVDDANMQNARPVPPIEQFRTIRPSHARETSCGSTRTRKAHANNKPCGPSSNSDTQRRPRGVSHHARVDSLCRKK